MSSYNRVILMGNLTRDPEVKTLPSGSVFANISLALNRRFSAANGEKREEVTYVDVTFWGKQAELFSRLDIRKGTPLFVEGRLHLDTWEDRATKQKRSKLKVAGETLHLVGGKRDSTGRPPAAQGAGHEHPQGGSSEPEPQSQGGFYSPGDDDAF